MTRRKKGGPPKPSAYGTPFRSGASASADVADRSQAFWQYRTLLESFVLTRFKWTGLPETVSERYLERTLMTQGQALGFLSEAGVPMGLKTVMKKFNVYGDPIAYEVFGENGWHEEIPEERGVWIWDTMTRYNQYPVINRYATKLANLDILQDANRDQQRQIAVFVGNEKNQQDLMMLARAMRMNEKSVMVDKDLIDSNPIQVLQTGVKYLQEDFNADKRSLINEFFDHYGIEHIAFDKNAHLLETEVKITSDAISRVRENCLFPRRLAAEKMSELFGTEITVDWRRDEYDLINPSGTNENGEVSEDE